MSSPSHADYIKAINQFLQKSDGRDKLCATIQYACMLISAGEPGNFKKVQASVAAARKVFRIVRPLETLTPVILAPGFNSDKPKALQALAKAKALAMSLYFAFDHVAWAGQAGLVQNRKTLETAQKISLWSWFVGSLCTIVTETAEIARLGSERREDESDEEWRLRKKAALEEANRRAVVLVHGSIQALLAVGLLQLLPWKPRTVGLLGTMASALNCYMLFPNLPRLESKKLS